MELARNLSPLFPLALCALAGLLHSLAECKSFEHILIPPPHRFHPSTNKTHATLESLHRSLLTQPCTPVYPPPRRNPPPPPPSKTPSAEINSWLKPHNDERASLGLPLLVWDDKIAASALAWAKDLARRNCALEYGGDPGLGQNLLWWKGGAPTNGDAVKVWLEDKSSFSYGPYPDCCSSGSYCGSYTQIIWKNTKKLGCARATCSNGAIEFVCDYYPPGNNYGEYPY